MYRWAYVIIQVDSILHIDYIVTFIVLALYGYVYCYAPLNLTNDVRRFSNLVLLFNIIVGFTIVFNYTMAGTCVHLCNDGHKHCSILHSLSVKSRYMGKCISIMTPYLVSNMSGACFVFFVFALQFSCSGN